MREATLEEFTQGPDFVEARRCTTRRCSNLWQDPVSYEGHKWGMAIDLNKCTGCNACVIACQAENNIPVVGKKNVAMGREMHWLRIDRYYKGDAENPELAFQPMPCQQCENAPCEQVCPVGATMHCTEGPERHGLQPLHRHAVLLEQLPVQGPALQLLQLQRRRDRHHAVHAHRRPKMKLKAMVFNPEVTVRSRGVMEKCTFCVQRIQNAKIKAKNAKRAVHDGEIMTACQETCPTEAIVFGDLNDESEPGRGARRSTARLRRCSASSTTARACSYLGRVRNPNPELTAEGQPMAAATDLNPYRDAARRATTRSRRSPTTSRASRERRSTAARLVHRVRASRSLLLTMLPRQRRLRCFGTASASGAT